MIMSLLAVLEPVALQGSSKVIAAVLFGIVLGFLIIKCDFAERKTVRENLTFANMKQTKTLLLALGLGVLVFSGLQRVHVLQSSVPSATFWGVLIGGVLSGIGLGVGGRVPSTAVAALASGKFYAFWVLLGMVLAIPAARLAAGAVPGMAADSQRITMSLKPGNGLFAFDSPVLWISASALMICLIMMLLGKRDDSGK